MTVTVEGSVSAFVPAAPDEVFAAITDIDRLPEWNGVMREVVERPCVLEPGAEWVVAFKVMGRRWRSRAVLEELDTEQRRFAYRSGTDDGNPSQASWAWEVRPDAAGSRVTVSWELLPVTFWRRVLLVRVRARQLARREVPSSLAALSAYVAARSGSDVAS